MSRRHGLGTRHSWSAATRIALGSRRRQRPGSQRAELPDALRHNPATRPDGLPPAVMACTESFEDPPLVRAAANLGERDGGGRRVRVLRIRATNDNREGPLSGHSLRETTVICDDATGQRIAVGSNPRSMARVLRRD